jgi:hypothetical protein
MADSPLGWPSAVFRGESATIRPPSHPFSATKFFSLSSNRLFFITFLERASGLNDDSTHPSPTRIILKYFERYGKHLFGHPTLRDADGTVLAVVELTNNGPEHFFGQEKHKLRRRLGRAHLARDLEDQPAQAGVGLQASLSRLCSLALRLAGQFAHSLC